MQHTCSTKQNAGSRLYNKSPAPPCLGISLKTELLAAVDFKVNENLICLRKKLLINRFINCRHFHETKSKPIYRENKTRKRTYRGPPWQKTNVKSSRLTMNMPTDSRRGHFCLLRAPDVPIVSSLLLTRTRQVCF